MQIKKIFPTCRKLLLEKFLRRVVKENGGTILIVGAGTDPYRDLFKNPTSYSKMDIKDYGDPEMIISDAHKLPFSDNSIDCIVATEVFEHLSSPWEFISEAHRVLVPGGRVYITVPFMFHVHGDPFDYWRPTLFCLDNLLKEKFNMTLFSHGNRVHVISDIITTSFKGIKILTLFRILNHLLVLLPDSISQRNFSSCPTGYGLKAIKK